MEVEHLVPEPVDVVLSRHRCTIPQISALSQEVVPRLHAALRAAGLETAGPMIYAYEGMDGRPETELTLLICQPVQGQGESPAGFERATLPSWECLSAMHPGSMGCIGQTYARLMQYAGAEGLRPTGSCREIYLRWVDDQSPDNLTQVQVGVIRPD